MHNTGEILQLCRLCLVKEQVNVPIFEGQGDVKQIFQKISSCLPVKINRSDKLPKNICDGCSEKLDLFYDFWNTSVNSEKQLLEWLGQTPLSAGAGTTIAAKNSKSTDPVQQIKVDVKQEPSDHTDNNESFQADASAVADEDETSFKSEGGPPPKRARRAATKRKPITVAPDTDDDDDDDYEPVEPLTKLEDESGNSDNDNEDDSFANAPSTSADDQPGPSGIGKDGVEAPFLKRDRKIKEELVLECVECSQTFSNRKTLQTHHMKHITGKWHVCYICHQLFDTAEELSLHKQSHPKKSYPCDLCGKTLKSSGAYHVHRRRHLQAYIKKCEECDVGFFTNQEYRLHMGSKHGSGLFVCDVCGKSLYDKASLQRHVATHTENYRLNTMYRCKICNKCYLQDRYLKKHYRRTHDLSNLNFICDICGRTLRTRQSLKNHKLTHEGNKQHQCVECGKAFLKKDVLQQHMRVHTGQKPYECPTCGKAFTQKTPLNVHMRIHTGERPYGCSLCELKFQTKAILNMHVEKKHFQESRETVLSSDVMQNVEKHVQESGEAILRSDVMHVGRKNFQEPRDAVLESDLMDNMEKHLHENTQIDLGSSIANNPEVKSVF